MRMEKKNILVVDDESINHFIYEKLLNTIGWSNKVYSAYSGSEALEILKDHCRGLVSMPDLILLDLHMPRMNGLEFIREFNALDCLEGKQERVVIAVVSSSLDPDEHEKARLLGARHIFSKPLSSVQLESLAEIEFN